MFTVYKMEDPSRIDRNFTDQELKRIRDQIRETYRKAFVDALKEKLSDDPPAYEWITGLYREIKDRLSSFLREGSRLRLEVEENMDVDLFDQMIRNDAFNPTDLQRLVVYTFAKCKHDGFPG